MRHTVFISYSVGDRETAERICASLESSGIACWIAPRDVLPGANYATVIVEAIEECRIFVVLLSAGSMHSSQVTREVERASSKSIPVIPFRLDPAPLSKAMEYFLSSSQWIDASSPPLERHLGVLVSAVFSILMERHSGEEPLPAYAFGNAPAPNDTARTRKARQAPEGPTPAESAGPSAGARGKRVRHAVSGGVLVAVAAVSCIVLLLVWRSSSDGSRISVSSDPPGAAVFLNGEQAGETPLLNYETKPGTVVIRLAHSSRPAKDTTVALKPGASMSLSFRLPEEAPPALKTSEPAKPVSRGSGRPLAARKNVPSAGTEGATHPRLATNLTGAAGLLLSSLHALVPQEPVLVTVLPFMNEQTPIGAEFSVAVKEALEAQVPQLPGWRTVGVSPEQGWGDRVLRGMTPRSNATHVLKGVYREEGANIRVQAALVRTRDQNQLGETSVLLPRSAVPAALLPANYAQVSTLLKSIASGAVTSTDLSLECWTNKGKENLIFRDGEAMQVFVRVNMPCFLRLIYHVADGTHLLMTIPDSYVSKSEVGKPFLLGSSLTVSAPFGGEALQILARSEEFPPLRDPNSRKIKESLEELLATTRRAKVAGGPLYQTEDCIVITTVKQ